MPLYFAYGANMDVAAMRERCPRSAPLGPARLAGFAFFVSEDGYASVRPQPGGVVHGLGWDLALRDVAALDRYEETEAGLYHKAILPVRFGPRTCQALVYVGRSLVPGQAAAGYLAPVIAAAERLQLPPAHLAELRRWMPGEARSSGRPSAHRRGPVGQRG